MHTLGKWRCALHVIHEEILHTEKLHSLSKFFISCKMEKLGFKSKQLDLQIHSITDHIK